MNDGKPVECYLLHVVHLFLLLDELFLFHDELTSRVLLSSLHLLHFFLVLGTFFGGLVQLVLEPLNLNTL
ncbi:hypothetical protein B0O80DRAFT_460583 [Mortierella sp. GBAus27b]|nr:hypothetical protein B0O80DRAFT_460583 [Mortierella sp. GBAus27b]